MSDVRQVVRVHGRELFSRRVTVALVVLAWIIGWLPPLMGVLQYGRALTVYGAVANMASPGGAIIRFSLQVVFLIVGVLGIVIGLSLRRLPSLWSATILSLPIVAVLFFGLKSSSVEFRWQVLLFVIFAINSLLAPPSLRALAYICVATVILALALGVTGHGLMPADWHDGSDKAIFPSILAGPYNQPNSIALISCLGLPLVLYVSRGRRRVILWILLLIAISWSASRTSLMAFLFVSAVYLALSSMSASVVRSAIASALLLGAAALVVIVPLTTTDPLALTGRGRIWQAILSAFSQSPVYGYGPYVLLEPSMITSQIGFFPYHGHNVAMSLLATGGLLALVTASLFLATSWVRALLRPKEVIVASLILVLLTSGVLEDTLRIEDISEVSWISWSLVVLLATQPFEEQVITPFAFSPVRRRLLGSGR